MVSLHRQLLENLLIPVKNVKFLSGKFQWPQKSVLSGFCDDDILPLRQLKDDLLKYSIIARLTRSSFGKVDLGIIRDKSFANTEAYRLLIKPDGIAIHSSSDAGAYYAIQTLRDIIQIFGKTIPAMIIEDEPDFVRRGVYHDCSRGKVPKLSTLKELVTRLTGK